MKAELVADSAEANPFPYKAQKPKKEPNAVTKKNKCNSAPKHSFLARPATHQTNSEQNPNAIIPALQELNRLKSKSARVATAQDSLRCLQECHQKLKRKQDVPKEN